MSVKRIAYRRDMPLVLFHWQCLNFYVSDDSALLFGGIFLFHPLCAGRKLLG